MGVEGRTETYPVTRLSDLIKNYICGLVSETRVLINIRVKEFLEVNSSCAAMRFSSVGNLFVILHLEYCDPIDYFGDAKWMACKLSDG